MGLPPLERVPLHLLPPQRIPRAPLTPQEGQRMIFNFGSRFKCRRAILDFRLPRCSPFKRIPHLNWRRGRQHSSLPVLWRRPRGPLRSPGHPVRGRGAILDRPGVRNHSGSGPSITRDKFIISIISLFTQLYTSSFQLPCELMLPFRRGSSRHGSDLGGIIGASSVNAPLSELGLLTSVSYSSV